MFSLDKKSFPVKNKLLSNVKSRQGVNAKTLLKRLFSIPSTFSSVCFHFSVRTRNDQSKSNNCDVLDELTCFVIGKPC